MDGFRCRMCPPPLPWLGTSPSPTSLLRPSAVVVRATVVGVASRCRNPSRCGVRDMLPYQSLPYIAARVDWHTATPHWALQTGLIDLEAALADWSVDRPASLAVRSTTSQNSRRSADRTTACSCASVNETG